MTNATVTGNAIVEFEKRKRYWNTAEYHPPMEFSKRMPKPSIPVQQSNDVSRATLIHVARLAGVGLGTASRALGDGKRVSAETVQRVTEAAKRLGYRRNEMARSLKVRRSGAVGIVIPDIGGAFMATCVRAAQTVIRENKYISVFAFTDDDPEVEISEVDYLVRRQVDGLLIVPAGGGARNLLERQLLQDTPLVSFDQPISGLDVDEVLVSNQAGAEKATRHMIEHGHKAIVYVTIDRQVPTLRARLKGYRRAMRAAGLKETVAQLGPNGEGAMEFIDSLLRAKRPPTAIFSANEKTSLEILPVLAMRNIKVPEQFALIAFDDVQLGLVLRSPMTVMRQPAAELGHRAATLLMERVLGKNDMATRRIVLDAELVVRRSCGCSPASMERG